MKKIIWHMIVILYVLVAVFITVCLLSYNEYNVAEFGDKLLVVVKGSSYDGYSPNDLLIIDKNDDYMVGSNIFYYVEVVDKFNINYGVVSEINDEIVVVDGEIIDSGNVISTDDNISVIPKLGAVLAALESRWGYLCFVILPILIAFVYEIYEIFRELRKKK